jgi:hypothetical protein
VVDEQELLEELPPQGGPQQPARVVVPQPRDASDLHELPAERIVHREHHAHVELVLHDLSSIDRTGVERQVIECLAGKLGLDPEDLRLQVLAELATIAFSVSGRHWVRHGGRGGREALLDRLDDAIKAIPASLDLSARP